MSDYEKWAKVFSTNNVVESSIVQSILKENFIECVEINKKDTAYLFGEIEIYVPKENAFEARQLIPDFSHE